MFDKHQSGLFIGGPQLPRREHQSPSSMALNANTPCKLISPKNSTSAVSTPSSSKTQAVS